MQHAASTLRRIFRNNVCREGSDAPLLAWPLACGSKIAERARALTFLDGTLTVAVPDETWRRQLQSFAMQYLSALNQISSAKVDRLDFVISAESR
jgi:Dna[CI] antecedent DciA-like protein